MGEEPAHRHVPLARRRELGPVRYPTRRAVLGTILFERVFAALRRGANAMRSSRISEGLPLPPAELEGRDRGLAER